MPYRQVGALGDGVFLLLLLASRFIEDLLEVVDRFFVCACLILRHTEEVDIVAHKGLFGCFRRLRVGFQVVHRLLVVALAVVDFSQHTVQLAFFSG